MFSLWARLIGVLLLLFPLFGSTAQTLYSIAEVRALMPDEVDGEIPIVVEGQVLCQRKAYFGVFIYDGNDGIYVSHREFPDVVDELQIGDWIQVKGFVEVGGFAPAIFGRSIQIIENKPIPEPMPYDSDDRSLASMDCQWVSIQGRLVSQSFYSNSQDVRLVVESQGKEYQIQTSFSPNDIDRLNRLMFQEVKLNAIAATQYNLRKQGIGRTFILNSTEDIDLLVSDSPESEIPFFSITQLMRKDFGTYDKIHTRGIVSGIFGNELFLRGDGAGLRVQTAGFVDIHEGDYVEMTGYVWPQPVSPAFRALDVDIIEKRDTPKARIVALQHRIDESLNYELIQTTASLIDVGKNFSRSNVEQYVLWCRAGKHLFEASLPPGEEINQKLTHGSELQLTGFAHLIHNPNTEGQLRVDGLSLQLRNSDDIQVIKEGPWWTPARVRLAFGIFVCILILVLAWVVLLRRTVNRKTRIISEQIEREAVLHERQRIARELHDNLEQGIAGIAIQLEGCLRQQETFTQRQLEATQDLPRSVSDLIQNDAKQTYASMKVVQEMLEYCSEESRSTIVELRRGLLERMDLPAALKETLEPLVKECDAQLCLNTEAYRAQFDKMLERDLLLVAKEAATNAVRHGKPKNLTITLKTIDNKTSLQIEDDGCGFDTNILNHTNRFGVQGIRERVGKYDGRVSIKSEPNKGTILSVEVKQ